MKTFLFFVILHSTLFILNCFPQQSGWQIIPSGTTAELKSIHYNNPFDLFVCGDVLLNVKSTDNGLTWQVISFSTPVTLNDIAVIDANVIVAVGSGGTIMRTTDGGSNWTTISSGVTDDLLSLSFFGNTGICGGQSQTILYSSNSGASWNIAQSGFFGGGFPGATMLSPQIGFVAGTNSIFQPLLGTTTDMGATWNFVSFYLNNNEGNATGVDFTDISTGYVSAVDWTGQGAIAKTTNGGVDWVTTFFTPPLSSIDFPISGASLVGYAAGDQGTILKTFDAGLNWSSQTTGTTQNLNKIYFSNLVEGYAVGENGIILRTVDGGVPVELTSFSVNTDGRNIFLNWTTASETNNSGFEIEKLFDDTWAAIGFVEGNGTTTEPNSYSFVDENLETGHYKYRLKQIDFDGTFEYSVIVAANVTALFEFELSQNYPNPFNPSTVISYQLPVSSNVTLKVFDIVGNEIATLVNEEKPAGEYEIIFDSHSGEVRNLPAGRQGLTSGIYFYQLLVTALQRRDGKAASFIQTKKMILIK